MVSLALQRKSWSDSLRAILCGDIGLVTAEGHKRQVVTKKVSLPE
jgi:hypothetical protein